MSRVSSIIIVFGLMRMTLATPSIARTMVVPQAHSFEAGNQVQNQELLQIFAGTIVLMDTGMFALKDDAKNAVYGLDNQALARKFADKRVLVTGTLDKTATIHVKNIEEQKALRRDRD